MSLSPYDPYDPPLSRRERLVTALLLLVTGLAVTALILAACGIFP